MARVRTAYFCRNCGAESAKWIGKCPSCGEWNTYTEEVLGKEDGGKADSSSWARSSGNGRDRDTPAAPRPVLLEEIEAAESPRRPTGDDELDRVLGGGLVPGSLVLVAGDPGIGKSTLLLQTALAAGTERTLYVSGEESARQIRLRADRLARAGPSGGSRRLYVLTETALARIFRRIRELEPELVIVDSVQTLHTDLVEAGPGSVSQIRTCAGELLRFAKETGTPVLLIGHINKEGAIAGPKVLEHMVDTVLQFEGDRHHAFRILRTVKNRFGSTSELGVYAMRGDGLHPVANPSELLIGRREEALPGVAVAAALEGLRPLLIEVQALVSPAVYGTPQRTVTGFDLRRLSMLLAVLEKRCGFPFGVQDVFVNIAGGLRVEDPAVDLAVVCALLSSFEDRPLPEDACFCGEVGLSGEVRAVPRIEARTAEAARLGYRRIFVAPGAPGHDPDAPAGFRVVPVGRVDEVHRKLSA